MGLNLLEQLKESRIGKQLERDFEAETFKKRKAAVEELKAIEKEANETMPKLAKEKDRALANLEAAGIALQRARTEYGRAMQGCMGASVGFSGRKAELEKILRDSCAEGIDKFKEEMNELLRLTRSKGIDHRDHGHRSIVDSKWKPKVYSDSPAVHGRIEYLRAAIAEAEGMKLEAMPIEEVAKRLKELKTRMPQVGVMQLIT